MLTIYERTISHFKWAAKVKRFLNRPNKSEKKFKFIQATCFQCFRGALNETHANPCL